MVRVFSEGVTMEIQRRHKSLPVSIREREIRSSSYLSNENAVAFQQSLVILAAGKELPDFSPKRLGDSGPHQSWQSLRPSGQVPVPDRQKADTKPWLLFHFYKVEALQDKTFPRIKMSSFNVFSKCMLSKETFSYLRDQWDESYWF